MVDLVLLAGSHRVEGRPAGGVREKKARTAATIRVRLSPAQNDILIGSISGQLLHIHANQCRELGWPKRAGEQACTR